MATKDTISKRLRNMLADHLSGVVLREIEAEFDAAGVPYQPGPVTGFSGGQRRTMVAAYYNGLDWSDPSDCRKFLDVLTVFMRAADRRHQADYDAIRIPWANPPTPQPPHPLAALLDELRRCGREWRDGEKNCRCQNLSSAAS